jgi:uncharacterized protein with NAD-binding domain and iron-sulfur cluster
VGGGIAGLVTAYELQKRGVRTHLLEAQPMTGGRIATANYGQGLQAEFALAELDRIQPGFSGHVLDAHVYTYHADGSIEPGKYADFVVLSDDILQVAPLDIAEVEVLATVLGGQVIHGEYPR